MTRAALLLETHVTGQALLVQTTKNAIVSKKRDISFRVFCAMQSMQGPRPDHAGGISIWLVG
jgi:hypothetical protein